jgi:NAD(P)-dependent dehydrogenase (short-subunit alcohol dehydrogenase family)
MHGTRNVIVTGSNKGIGYGIAENLAGKGWNVIMAVRNLALGA